MANNQLYIDTINDAIAAGKLENMKALLLRAKKQAEEHKKIETATKKLAAAVSKLEKGK
jgi:hypothetical protein